jgi:ribonuclease H / adenosylcobalamin/alpha-ribazole phosphatase
VSAEDESGAGAASGGRIWLVRHAPTDWTGVRWCGRSDPSLSAAGRDAAERIAAEIARDLGGGRTAEAIVLSSPLRRALQTAAAIAQTIGSAPVQIEPDLTEIDVGVADGLTWDELAAAYPDLAAAVLAGASPDWPGGETRAQAASRARSATHRIVAAVDAHAVVVASHAGLLREIADLLSRGAIASWSFEPASALRLDLVGGLWVPAAKSPVGVG